MQGRRCDHLCLAVASVTGVLGALALIGAWVATRTGIVLGLDSAHLFEDAKALLLLGIFSLLFVQLRATHGAMCEPCGGGGACCGRGSCGASEGACADCGKEPCTCE